MDFNRIKSDILFLKEMKYKKKLRKSFRFSFWKKSPKWPQTRKVSSILYECRLEKSHHIYVVKSPTKRFIASKKEYIFLSGV